MKTVIIDVLSRKREFLGTKDNRASLVYRLVRGEADRRDGGQQERKQRSCCSVLCSSVGWLLYRHSAVLPRDVCSAQRDWLMSLIEV